MMAPGSQQSQLINCQKTNSTTAEYFKTNEPTLVALDEVFHIILFQEVELGHRNTLELRQEFDLLVRPNCGK